MDIIEPVRNAILGAETHGVGEFGAIKCGCDVGDGCGILVGDVR
jgi:hypothetical protein